MHFQLVVGKESIEMIIHDISLSIDDYLPIWEGDPLVHLERVSKLEEGCQSNITQLEMSIHTGTHIDAPFHFLRDGNTVDQISLEILVGPAQVIHLPDSCNVIDSAILSKSGIDKGIERVLFRTRNSLLWKSKNKKFQKEFVAVNSNGANFLKGTDIKLVGIDYLSIAAFDDIESTHKILLGAGIVALEGLNLSKVNAGMYKLFCLPLNLVGCEGAPARAILLE